MNTITLVRLSFVVTAAVCASTRSLPAQEAKPYVLNAHLQSRAISHENRTGAPGQGGQAASELGVGRKGAPKYVLSPGETFELCDIVGSGTIRHVWMTGHWFDFSWSKQKGRKDMLRRIVVRAYWDGQEHPSIECPLGDFMGLAHGEITPYESAVHTVGPEASLNLWLPMPFAERARITLTNEADVECEVYYQSDYTLGDRHEGGFGRLHTLFRRENPTTLRRDFELLPKRTGKGRYIGTVIGVRSLHPGWWGEGEVKVYLDGDEEFPTICGTGSEDYVGLSYGMQAATYRHLGCNLRFTSPQRVSATKLPTGETVEMQREFVSMYRWHLPDPMYWQESCRITVQQIGCCYYERADDWSAATFWYEPIPSAPLPPFPGVAERIADLAELQYPTSP